MLLKMKLIIIMLNLNYFILSFIIIIKQNINLSFLVILLWKFHNFLSILFFIILDFLFSSSILSSTIKSVIISQVSAFLLLSSSISSILIPILSFLKMAASAKSVPNSPDLAAVDKDYIFLFSFSHFYYQFFYLPPILVWPVSFLTIILFHQLILPDYVLALITLK